MSLLIGSLWYIFVLVTISLIFYYVFKSHPAKVSPSANYNAFIYEKLVDPMIIGLHKAIASKIKDNTTVFEAASGTGQFAFLIAHKVKKFVGVDLSPKMVKVAQKKLVKIGAKNVQFIHGDVIEEAKKIEENSFDIAVICMTLHEIQSPFRLPILRSIAKLSKRVIVVDYAHPMPLNFQGIRNRIIEFFAGSEHFANFRNFRHEGGLQSLIASAPELEIIEQKVMDHGTLCWLELQTK